MSGRRLGSSAQRTPLPLRTVAPRSLRGCAGPRLPPMLALVGVTAIWGYTFVPVQEAVAIYPLFAFLAVRFAISTLVLAPFAWRSLRRCRGAGSRPALGAGALLAAAYGLQTAGLDLTTVAEHRLHHRALRRADAAARARALPHARRGRRVGGRRALGRRAAAAERHSRAARRSETRSCSGTPSRSRSRSWRWSASRRATTPRALTFLQMAVACAAFTVIALSRGELTLPHDGSVWYALVVTGVFAGALGYLVATWVQSRTTAARAALVFTLEAPFAALFGVLLLSERLGCSAGRAAP